MLHAIHGMGENKVGAVPAQVATTVAEIEAARLAGGPAIIPVVENGHAIGETLDHLDEFRPLGARYMTLIQNGHNALADSSVPRRSRRGPSSNGLSPGGQGSICRRCAAAASAPVNIDMAVDRQQPVMDLPVSHCHRSVYGPRLRRYGRVVKSGRRSCSSQASFLH